MAKKCMNRFRILVLRRNDQKNDLPSAAIGSTIEQDVDYPKDFHEFNQSFKINSAEIIRTRPETLPFKSFPLTSLIFEMLFDLTKLIR
jgi:hypothetical protein